MLAVICGNIRMIALPTLVTALVEEDRRDKANGLVGMVTGMGFLLTSGISGFLVAWDGIRGTLVLAIRSEEHTSELQSLMRISYAVFCLQKKNTNTHNYTRLTKI